MAGLDIITCNIVSTASIRVEILLFLLELGLAERVESLRRLRRAFPFKIFLTRSLVLLNVVLEIARFLARAGAALHEA